MIPLQNLVVEDGKIKRVYTIVQEYRESPGSQYAAPQISRDGIHSGRIVVEDLPDAEAEELSEALKELGYRAEAIRRADSTKRRIEGHGVPF